MNSAIERHPLGVPMLEGNSKTVQLKANTYFEFAKKDICIIRYKYITDCHERLNVYSEKDLIKKAEELNFSCVCEVCGTKLYKESLESGSVVMRLKKQIIFIDTSAKKHYVCYQVNACYRKAGMTTSVNTINAHSEDTEHLSSRIKIPSLNSTTAFKV